LNKKTTPPTESALLAVFQENPEKAFTYPTLCKTLGLPKKQSDLWEDHLMQALERMAKQGKLQQPKHGVFLLPKSTKIQDPPQANVEGIVDLMPSGAAFVAIDGFQKDVYISSKNTMQAQQGDRVSVCLKPVRGKGRPEGEITAILARDKTQFVGLLDFKNGQWTLLTDTRSTPVLQLIDLNPSHQKPGYKAIATITDWGNARQIPRAKILTLLGKAGEHQTEMHAILAEFGLPYEFPKEVERDAARIDGTITASEIRKRRDFRSTDTFTIDPADAKDFDDALSFKNLGKGLVEVGIHIADVAHYLQPGSLLDEEAIQRATSVYLVDRVVPMLPEILSNGLCSLNPKEDKLCFSAVFTLNEEAQVVEQWFGRTIIHSNHRFSYEEAQLVLETGEGPYALCLKTLDDLAKKMRAERLKAGAIAFDKKEVKFKLNPDGSPSGVYFKEMKDSNHLIEDFMLLANRKVAEFIGKRNPSQRNATGLTPPFVYRVHDKPNEEKLRAFSTFVKKLGYQLKTEGHKEIARSMNRLLHDVHGKKEANVVEQLAIRSMAKATYTTQNIGHYGLSFDYYTHFTSPIRRYPDVMAHRLLALYLSHGASPEKPDWSSALTKRILPDVKILEAQCRHSSDMEKKASEAERASIKYKQIEFMQTRVGQLFKAVVSGVSEFGIFAEIEENQCEGLVRLRDITEDFFQFDPDHYCVMGRKSKRVIRLGDEIWIRVKKADLRKKQLDFSLVWNTQ
jgi:ribonuclease R